jgi:hypothetical protein
MKRSLLVFFLVFPLVGIALADQTAGKPLQVTEVGKDSFQGILSQAVSYECIFGLASCE